MGEMLRARLFGALSVEIDGHAVPEIAGLKPRSVLAWLLLHPGSHARARVAAAFWPDVLDTSARASLRSALWTVRAALDAAGGSDHLVADRDSVGILGRRGRDVDTETFVALCSSDDPCDLERALELAGAPLLTDLADDWVLEARDEYGERAAAVALRLADAAEAAGDLRQAAAWTRRALVHARLNEATHRVLVRRLAAAGELAEALAAYRRLEAILADEFRTAPSPESRALIAELQGDRAVVPLRRRSRPETSLVGRDRELAALISAWEDAERGSGGVALVSGAAGMGKSRLAGELAELVGAKGAARATGTAFELAGSPPFSLWLDALDELVAEAPPPLEDAAWPAELARLCPAVERRWGRPAAASPADPGLGRARLFGSVIQAIDWAAAQRPLLMLLEDLHLADRASLALLGHVAPRLARTRTLLVATHRPIRRDELDAALDALAGREAVAVRLTLGPLPTPAIETITDATAPDLPDGVRARLVGAAEGSPLLALEGARAALGGNDPAEGLRAWVRTPRVALPSSARVLVDFAAAAARPLSIAEAAELLGRERLADALAAGTAAQLLDRDSGGVRFSHELVREACYAEIDPARRARLHSRLADVLSQRPRPQVAEVARHLLLAHDEERARSYLAAAAEKARALGALDDAAGFLREAASAAPDAVAGELWLSLAEVEAWRGNRRRHDAAFERALPLIEAGGDAAAVAGAHAARGRFLRTTLCYPREALAAYRRAAEIVELAGLHAPELRALALAGAAWAEAAAGDVDEAESLIARVQRLPEAERDAALAAELELDRATALMRSGSFAASEGPSLRAAQLAHRAGRADLARVALNFAASAAAAQGDFQRSLEHTRRAGDSDPAGTTLEMETMVARAYALSRLGRHEEAVDAAARAQALAARSGDGGEQAIAEFDAGTIALAAGRASDASKLLCSALEQETERLPRALARLRLAEARLRLGELEAAGAEIERFAFESVRPADFPEALVPQLERLQGSVAAARGERELALRHLEHAERGWRRILASAGVRDPVAASLVDLGRAPVAGLVEPAAELGRTLADRALLLAEGGNAPDARAVANEASRLADDLSFDGYRATLERTYSVMDHGAGRARV